MSNLPVLSSVRLIKILRKIGFEQVRQKGSHAFFAHRDGRTTVVPVHKGRDIGKGLLREILKEIEISADEFVKFTRKRVK